MGMMASQTTSLTIVYSTIYSGADKKKTSKLRVTDLCVLPMAMQLSFESCATIGLKSFP